MLWILLFTLYNADGDIVAQIPYITPTEAECYIMGEGAVDDYGGEEEIEYACGPAPFVTLQESQAI